MRNPDRRLAAERPKRIVRWRGKPTTIQTRVLGPGRVWISTCGRYRITRYLEGSGLYLVSRAESPQSIEGQTAVRWVMVGHARGFAGARREAEHDAESERRRANRRERNAETSHGGNHVDAKTQGRRKPGADLER